MQFPTLVRFGKVDVQTNLGPQVPPVSQSFVCKFRLMVTGGRLHGEIEKEREKKKKKKKEDCLARLHRAFVSRQTHGNN